MRASASTGRPARGPHAAGGGAALLVAGHPNITLMQQSYEALGRGDVAFLESTAAPDFSFSVSGTSAISGTVGSVREAAEGFAHSMELTAGDLSMEPAHLLADDQAGIVILDVKASRPDGRQTEQRVIHEWSFSGGKVQGIREWIWDQAAGVDFWA